MSDVFEQALTDAQADHTKRVAEAYSAMLGIYLDDALAGGVTKAGRALHEQPRCSYCGTRQRSSWAKCPNCGAPS